MTSEQERPGLIEDYLGIDPHRLYVLLALVAGVLVVVTGIYIAIFGFQHWKTNMQRAGAMMVINFEPQPNVPEAVQYLCPHCGVIGIPRWSSTGTPVCPGCGAKMGTIRQ